MLYPMTYVDLALVISGSDRAIQLSISRKRVLSNGLFKITVSKEKKNANISRIIEYSVCHLIVSRGGDNVKKVTV